MLTTHLKTIIRSLLWQGFVAIVSGDHARGNEITELVNAHTRSLPPEEVKELFDELGVVIDYLS